MPDNAFHVHQERWVLLSASADHPSSQLSAQLVDHDLLTSRQCNRDQPQALQQKLCRRRFIRGPHRCALLLTGELRCLSRSRQLLIRLSRQADLFIVTTAAYAQTARSLVPEQQLLVVDECPRERRIDRTLAVGSMKQWHKLSLALQLVKNAEHRLGRRYSQLLKLRSDYFYVHPRHLLRDVMRACQPAEAGLVGASDKVFAGPRDLMMLFQGFFENIEAWFDAREQHYWPINLRQVLASDEALKWYGMNWPVELIGRPETTDLWRQHLSDGGDALQSALAQFKPGPNVAYHHLFQGHPRFASEVSFARFLNFNGIPFRDCPSLRGFLYSDRSTCP